MPITAWTIYGNHPRIHCRNTDKTGGIDIQGMSNSTAQWKGIWDTYVLGYCNQAIGLTDVEVAGASNLDARFWCLGLAGWIDSVTSYHTKLKGAALALANDPTIWEGWNGRREQVMAIGDQGNDLTMLDWAGLGVAMGNGSDEVKAVADWVAPPIDEDGVAVAIERFVLSGAG